jgi:exodeoxyribonuclease V alpha subunit
MSVHGGVIYRGSAAEARSYVEADRSRVDDSFLAEGTGLATRYFAGPATEEGPWGTPWDRRRGRGTLNGPATSAGLPATTSRRGNRRAVCVRIGLRFVEVVVNGPKTWSLAGALHPEIAAAYDAAQDRAAHEIIGWVADHPHAGRAAGRQVQVPVERLEAAVVRHYTSRAATLTGTFTYRSTPVCSRPGGGGGCIRSVSWTASRR